jgi:hypothetical protein
VGGRRVHDRSEGILEGRLRKALRVLPDGGTIGLAVDDPANGSGELSGVCVRDEHPRQAIDNRFERAALAERDDGSAARLRFDRDDAEILDAGEQNRG